MKKATLSLNNIELKPHHTHKFRGYIGNVFADYDLIHNHDLESGKNLYRYPLIQFKIIRDTPTIIALTDKAVSVFTDIFMNLEEIVIDDLVIPVYEKDLKVEEVKFGFADEHFLYEFKSPWIALNQKNYQAYKCADYETQTLMLSRILTGNIISMAKYLNYTLSQEQRINTKLEINQQTVTLKGTKIWGFKGYFKTNFHLPDNIGLGKSVSRGFGNIGLLL
ncbi:MAG: DNA repair protein [Desulfamplus sp.]|nr:DNA repair protein [Desulfamplus sp.]